MSSRLRIILWKDIFVVIDDGRVDPADYPKLGRLVFEQAKRHVNGIGSLTLIPPNAKPPTPEARNAISELLASLGPALKCACWLVEGGGFQGAMVRAVLTGLRMFGRYPYPTHVSTNMEEALGWLVLQLGGGAARLGDVSLGVEFVRMQRRAEQVGHVS